MANVTKEERMAEFKRKVESESNVASLYNTDEVNQKEFFKDYADILLNYGAKKLLDRIESNPKRENSYKVESHNGKPSQQGKPDDASFRVEDREAVALFNYFQDNADARGDLKIIDYQMPLRNTNKDDGKAVDLIGCDGTNVYLLEYKNFTSDDTLLKSILQVYTYRRLLENGKEKVCADYGFPSAKLLPAIIMMENSAQHKSFTEQKDSPILRLIRELGISVFVIKPSTPFSENDATKNSLAKERPTFNFDLSIEKINTDEK